MSTYALTPAARGGEAFPMPQDQRKPLPPLLPTLALALFALGAWAAWLGWDQTRDLHPDGSTTGPYEAWQVIGLLLTLLPPLYWAASRRHLTASVLGIPAGLTVAAYVDWSDDASGLFMVGVVITLLGTLTATALASALITATTRTTPRAGT
ncbi:hypothetical protein ACFYVL_35505 [Streptomyces sp. NPDC004111]|uniref:hypothetical protein n=1 Tax=Streptomyces sp. NPDC004111 TaxID=3364690 RepID=UPI0036CDBC02